MGEESGQIDFRFPETRSGPEFVERRHPRSVVVVDDTPVMRELVVGVLESIAGIKLAGVGADGHDALKLATEISPALMILDLRMPHLDGVAAIPLLREKAPDMRILVYTSEADLGALVGESRPDATVRKEAGLAALISAVLTLLSLT